MNIVLKFNSGVFDSAAQAYRRRLINASYNNVPRYGSMDVIGLKWVAGDA